MKGYIYKILNKVNGKFYIGSTKNLVKRRSDHIAGLTQNKHPNQYLQNAYNLCKGNFKFLVIEVIEDCTRELLIEREQYFIDTLEPHYNIHKIAYSPLGYKHTEEAIRKMTIASQNMSKETKQKISLAHLGVSKSNEHSLNISLGKKGKRMKQESIDKMAQTKIGSKQSEETKIKRSASMLGKNAGANSKMSIPINQYKKENNELIFIKEWASRGEIERELKFSGANIQKCCKGTKGYSQAYGYVWKYKETNNEI